VRVSSTRHDTSLVITTVADQPHPLSGIQAHATKHTR